MARKPRPRRLRVGDLERETGLTRDVIHHYVRLGLLPAPEKTAATVAWYDDRHVAALLRVKAMRAEGLSLPDIQRLLAGAAAPLGPRDVKRAAALLSTHARPPVDRASLPPASRALAQAMHLRGDAIAPAFAALLAATEQEPRVREALTRCLDAAEHFARVAHGLTVDTLTLDGAPSAKAAERVRLFAGVLDAWQVHLTQAHFEAALHAARRASTEAARAHWRPVAAAWSEGAVLRLVVLDQSIARGGADAALHVERVRLLLATGPSKRAGEAAMQARAAGVDEAWVMLAMGVAALDGDDPAAARAHCEAALARRPRWGLARAFHAAAVLWEAAKAGDGMLDAGAAVATLDTALDDPADAPEERARTGLVLAQTMLALPADVDRTEAAVERLRGALAVAQEVPAHALARGTGALARVEANVWLTLGDALARRDDLAGAREAWTRAVAWGGSVAHEARAKLRGALEGAAAKGV